MQHAPARFPFPALPRGWFAVALSSDLAPGEVRRERYFGRELVLFRGESGRAAVAGAYCPHLGAHLAHGGAVEGDAIRCPFHGWRFDAEGRCASIPYSAHVPPRTRLDALPVLERDGVIHVFFDPDGGEPWPLPELDHEGWTPGRAVVWRALRTHPQEIFENTVDIAHIGPVHSGRGARLCAPPRRERERMRVELEFQAPGDVVGMPGQLNDVHLAVTMVGLGWTSVETHVRNVGVRARQRILVTPVDEETVDIRGIVSVRETDDPAFTEELARLFYEAYVEDFAKDFPIWENKRYLDRPRLAKGDGPIGTYRKWCEQFYAGAAPSQPARALPDVSLASLRASALRALAPLEGRLRALVARRTRRGVAPSNGTASSNGAAPSNGAALSNGAASSNDAAASNGAASNGAASSNGAATSNGAALSNDTASNGASNGASSNGAASNGASNGAATWNGAAGSNGAAPSIGTAASNGAASNGAASNGAAAEPRARARRVSSAREYRDTLPERFVPDAAAGIDAVFQWELGGEGGEIFHAEVKDGRLEVRDGPHPRPTVTLVMKAEDYVRVVNGELDGMAAFMTGRGRARGDLRMAMKMRSLFPA